MFEPDDETIFFETECLPSDDECIVVKFTDEISMNKVFHNYCLPRSTTSSLVIVTGASSSGDRKIVKTIDEPSLLFPEKKKKKKLGKNRKEKPSDKPRDLLNASSEIHNHPWAMPYLELWQFQPKNFNAEKEYNLYCAGIEPHCAICSVFKPLIYEHGGKSRNKQIPAHSTIWMPTPCFRSQSEGRVTRNTRYCLTNDSAEGINPLLMCKECKVCVHASCYGVVKTPTSDVWKCSRCMSKNQNAECCLCTVRGGALKPTTDGKWAHVLCGALIAEVFFDNALTKEPINVSKVTRARMKLKCHYCYKFVGEHKKITGACIQCTAGKCCLPFHVTCAHLAGVTFETCDPPINVYMTCTRHTKHVAKETPKERQLPTVKVGSKVTAKHKNGRYYPAEIVERKTQTFYSVDFDDGTFSNDILPEDIISRDCVARGPPESGERVQVHWTDENNYGAVFIKATIQEMFGVEFEDGSELTVHREDLYTQDEKLPKKVLSRLSTATERQHAFDNVEIGGKRPRSANAKYASEHS